MKKLSFSLKAYYFKRLSMINFQALPIRRDAQDSFELIAQTFRKPFKRVWFDISYRLEKFDSEGCTPLKTPSS